MLKYGHLIPFRAPHARQSKIVSPAAEFPCTTKRRSNSVAYASLKDFNIEVEPFLDSGIVIFPIQGDVCETLVQNRPLKIALLRIDTDMYDVVKSCLAELWPLISPGGVVIIDGYDHCIGARKATDEYFLKISKKSLSMRIDTRRILIK